MQKLAFFAIILLINSQASGMDDLNLKDLCLGKIEDSEKSLIVLDR